MNCPRCGHAAPVQGALTGICPQCLARDLFEIEGGVAPPPIPDEAAGGAPCGRYLKVKELGRGGMGEVWKAWDTVLGRWVALKFLKGDVHDHDRFLREAQIAGALTHPNIAAVYETGDAEGRPYIAFQYLEGVTLESFPRKDRDQAVTLVRDAALAMDYAHAKGVIHRDLKPSNLMAVPSSGHPGQHRVCIMDFGLARPIGGGRDLSQTGVVLGTPAYMSPEQAGGETLDARSDVYGLGATLYDILSGRPPFSGKDVYEILDKIRKKDPWRLKRLAPDIPQDLETVVLKCLEKDPARRYPSARALADDLTRFLEGRPVDARPPSVVYHVSKWIRRNTALSTAYAAVVLALVAAGVLFARGALERANERVRLEETKKAALEAALERAREREREVEAAKKALERSEALRLAAHSGGALASNPTLALLLALEAGTHHQAPAVQNALRSSIDALREIRTMPVSEATRRASFSSDGKLLFTMDRVARLWDGRTGELRRLFPMGLCDVAAISPDSRRVITLSRSGAWEVWDVETGKVTAQFQREGDPTLGHGPYYGSFSPDGKRFAMPAGDNTTALLDVETARPAAFLKGHEGKILGAEYSPDGAKVVTWSEDQTVRVWRAADGAPLVTLDWLKRKEEGAVVSSSRRPTLLVAEQVSFSPDSRRVLVTTPNGSKVWSLEPLREEYDLGAMSRFAAFSPDGRRLLSHQSGDQFAWVLVHDLKNRKVSGTLRGHRGSIWSASFSPTGRWVVTASSDRTARIWDPETATELAQYLGHPGEVTVAQLSPDEKVLYTATRQSSHLWHPARGARRSSLPDQGSHVQTFAISPDGTNVATQRDHSSTQIWDLDQGTLVRTLKDAVGDPHFSPDGQSIYGAHGSAAGIWDAATGERRAVMSGHEDQVLEVVRNPAGDTFVTTGMDGNVFLWDAAGRRLPPFLHSPRTYFAHAELNREGTRLAVPENDRLLAVYDFPALTGRREFAGHAEAIQSVQWSPDGRWLCSVGRDGAIKVWNGSTAALQLSVPTTDWLHVPRFTSDGRKLLALTGSKGAATVELWDVPEARRLVAVTEPSGLFWQMAVSADAGRFLLSDPEAGGFLYDTETGKRIRQYPPPLSTRDPVFHPDGKRLITSSVDGIAVVDLESGERRASRLADTGIHSGIEISPDGKRMVVNVWHNSVAIHDLKNPGREVVLTGHGWQIWDIAFSPDGKRVVTASFDQTAKVWDAATGERLLRLDGHSDRVQSARFCNDGSRILTRTEDGALTLWDASDGKKLFTRGGAEDSIEEAEFIAGTRRAIAVHRSGKAVIHDERESRPLPLESSVLNVRASPFGPQALLLEGTRRPLPAGLPKEARRGVSVAPQRSGVVRLWDLAEGRELRRFTQDRAIADAMWTSGGTQILTLEISGNGFDGGSGRLRLWDAAGGRELRELAIPGSGVSTVRASLDGKYLFAGVARSGAASSGGRLFDLQRGSELVSFPSDVPWAEARFAADGKLFVTRSHAGELRVHPIDPFPTAPSKPRDFSADELELYEIGTPEERAGRTWDALSPFLRDLRFAASFLREFPDHPGAPSFAAGELTMMKPRLSDFSLKGPPPPAVRQVIAELRALAGAHEELNKALGEVESKLDEPARRAPARDK